MAQLWFLMRPGVTSYTNGDCVCIPGDADLQQIRELYGDKRSPICPVHPAVVVEPTPEQPTPEPNMSQLSEGGRLLEQMLNASQ